MKGATVETFRVRLAGKDHKHDEPDLINVATDKSETGLQTGANPLSPSRHQNAGADAAFGLAFAATDFNLGAPAADHGHYHGAGTHAEEAMAIFRRKHGLRDNVKLHCEVVTTPATV